ncbi:hypothetical protein [Azospirillum sp. SYSU D00513]|uniref:hypothetical protein n=1 Tax=Azospirillum sp. SYSU D00513 TaxID=2812561 RepID=UPI001A966F61|nr:hypothetical protein [Azospirillum sp. SYSU D00513]
MTRPDPPAGATPTPAASPDVLPVLRERLLDIPEAKFVEVVRLLEHVRDHPDVRQTFATIRPRLSRVRPARRPTLKRILCMPFEDVLETLDGVDVPLGRIERRVIEPVWRIVRERADAAQLAALERAVQGLDAANRNGLLNVGGRLWPLAAAALHGALDGDGDRRLLWTGFGGDEALAAQARSVAHILEIGSIVESLKAELSPRPVPALGEGHVAAIEQAAQAAARLSPKTVYYLLLIAASRLAAPAGLLDVLNDLDLGRANREQPALFAQLSGLVVANLEERTARMDGPAAGATSPDEAVDIALRLIQGLDTTSAVMDHRNETAYRERLAAVRGAVRTMLDETVIRTAPRGVLDAIALIDGDGTGLTRDDEAQTAAEDHARALRRCEALADSLEMRHTLEKAIAGLGAGLTKRANALVAAYPRLVRRAPDPETAELSLFYALRLVELVAGPIQAEELRRATMAMLAQISGDEP